MTDDDPSSDTDETTREEFTLDSDETDADRDEFGFDQAGDDSQYSDFEMGGNTFDFGGEDEVVYHSSIPRLDLGIDGLDEMIAGGIPTESVMAVIGDAGTGKTTFGLQFLQHGLEQNDTGVYITLEESSDAVLDTAETHGWAFRDAVANDELAVISLNPIRMANQLERIENDLIARVIEFGADRLVLDSVSVIEMMYDSRAERRTEMFEFINTLKEAGVTTLFTSEASQDSPYQSRYGMIEYAADVVFILRYVREEGGETRLAVEIQKIRNAKHDRNARPYELQSDGFNVYRDANVF